METLLHHYAYGRPVETHVIDATTKGETRVIHQHLGEADLPKTGVKMPLVHRPESN